MTFKDAVARFFTLVEKVESGTTARSENDLSANLASCLQALKLSTVLDTGVSNGTRKRPDILAYVRLQEADLVLPADIVIESKKPQELRDYGTITDAVCSGWFWREKTVPYIRDNLTRVQYFVLTTFTAFAIVTVTDDLRRGFIEWRPGDDKALRAAVRANTRAFRISPPCDERDSWRSWVQAHFTAAQLAPVPISAVISAYDINSREELEHFADRLAAFTAGDAEVSHSGLFESVRTRLPRGYDLLDGFIKRDLHLFLMIQQPGMSLPSVEAFAREHPEEVVSEFVGASIHSLIGRLFALKVIEDKFCVREDEPLIARDYWLFRSPRYDGKSSGDIRRELFQSLRTLRSSGNSAIQRFAEYGFFFDWIEGYIEPVVFRSLFEMIASRDFENLEGDLLGRFFELYAQKINRTKRRALGQYYTPRPVVELMWSLVAKIVDQRGVKANLNVLDPGMGSGTFLTEGARLLAKAGIPQFWSHLSGFDISAQVLGIAYVNLYIAVLGQLNRREAEQVGDLHVYATDALDPRNGQYLKQILPLIPDVVHKQFVEERIRISTEVKRSGKFTVVIGNPPYRNNSNRTLSQMAAIFPSLLQTSVQHARAQEMNVRDDYAWFFAAADFYVQQSGVIAFIVSDSFAQKRSYRYFRQDLLRRYHIRHLIRLGAQVFQDVGPRIDFAIVVLEKRMEALPAPNEDESHPYVDVRPFATRALQQDLGTENDPRFQVMQAAARGQALFPEAAIVFPRRALNYSLYPLSPIVDRVRRTSLPLFEKRQERIFASKWPGLVTAFDELFKARTQAELVSRMTAFFEICNRPRLNARGLNAALELWGRENGIPESKYERLGQLTSQIRHKGLVFDTTLVKRALDGAMPNEIRWYPPRSNQVFIYYEVRLDIPRNENEGRAVGWGTMQQWREPLSHTISPKLIYTTAAKQEYGLKAFVVDDSWYVKKHGGTSQQYNYTGLVNPLQPHRMDGLPNNLSPGGLQLLSRLSDAGLPNDAFNFYVAAVYNSEVATEFLEEVSSSSPFQVRIPEQNQLEVARDLAVAGRRLRDLHWLLYLAQGTDEFEAVDLTTFDESLLSVVNISRQTVRGRRFKAREVYKAPNDLPERIRQQADSTQEDVDRLAVALYS